MQIELHSHHQRGNIFESDLAKWDAEVARHNNILHLVVTQRFLGF
jgi:hypothetical protein